MEGNLLDHGWKDYKEDHIINHDNITLVGFVEGIHHDDRFGKPTKHEATFHVILSECLKMIMQTTTHFIATMAQFLFSLISHNHQPFITLLVVISFVSIIFGFYHGGEEEEEEEEKVGPSGHSSSKGQHMSNKQSQPIGQHDNKHRCDDYIRSLAMNSVWWLFIIYLILYGGYGETSSLDTFTAATMVKDSSRGGDPLPLPHDSTVAARIFTSLLSTHTDFFVQWENRLSRIVLMLPLISSLHLHRFLIGLQFASIMMMPLALEVMSYGFNLLHSTLFFTRLFVAKQQPQLSNSVLGSDGKVKQKQKKAEQGSRIVGFLIITCLLSPSMHSRFSFMITEMKKRTLLSHIHETHFNPLLSNLASSSSSSSSLDIIQIDPLSRATNDDTSMSPLQPYASKKFMHRVGRVYAGDRNRYFTFMNTDLDDDEEEISSVGIQTEKKLKYDDIPFVRLQQLKHKSGLVCLEYIHILLFGL
jgi:hypothetical protein